MRERLQKVLASHGVASRRRSEELIAAGQVTVNGRPARIGDTADPETDEVAVRGRLLNSRREGKYIALNKPRGYVSSLRSTHGEPTIMDLLDVQERLYPVGRLDKETSGLLLLTNDGDWANHVTHPRYGIEKEYKVLVRCKPTRAALQRLRDGVMLPDGTVTTRAQVSVAEQSPEGTWLTIVVVEGKKRQIRLMAEAVGHPVIELQRVRVGPVVLGSLPEASWRHLTAKEIESIRKHGRHGATTGHGGERPPDRNRRAGRSRQIDSRSGAG